MAEEIKYDRRRFLAIAAMSVAAAEFGRIRSADAQSSKTNPAGLRTIKPGTNRSFGALKQIDACGGRPAISENGQRIEWRIAEPKPGTRYLCVAFHQNGLQFWNDDLQKNSLVGRMRRLAGRLAPSLAQSGEQPHT